MEIPSSFCGYQNRKTRKQQQKKNHFCSHFDIGRRSEFIIFKLDIVRIFQ